MNRLKFTKTQGFRKALTTKVERILEENSSDRTGGWPILVKGIVILLSFICSYSFLFYNAHSPWAYFLGIVWLSQSIVLIGFNLAHEGSHNSISKHQWINRAFAMGFELTGVSHLVWHHQHNILHHTYTNIYGYDHDLETDGLIRLSPHSPWKPIYRFQHIYAFGLYAVLGLFWTFFADFRTILVGNYGGSTIPRTPTKVAFFLIAKGLYFTYMLVIPAYFHPLWQVALIFVGVQVLEGLTLSLVFQMAHIVQEASFPLVDNNADPIENEWTIHQISTTANFATKNPLLNWYVGGLNYQVEHHIFPGISNRHYPKINRALRETCAEFGVRYLEFPTVWAALKSHYCQLKSLGQPA